MNEDLFRVLIMGNFCSGKSTLTNALLGKEICPAFPLPTTAVCTEIVYGQHSKMTVYPSNQSKDTAPIVVDDPCTDDIDKYVSYLDEEGIIPYDKVVIECESDILKEGFQFIDSTPLLKLWDKNSMLKQYVLKADAIIYCMSSSMLFYWADKEILEDLNPNSHCDISVHILLKSTGNCVVSKLGWSKGSYY